MGEENQKHNTANWAPGTLDKTRQNIGPISDREAEEMSKKLGGEVMYEKSTSGAAKQKATGAIVRTKPAGTSSTQANRTFDAAARKRMKTELPNMSKKSANAINKLMMSSEYQIKPNYGIFNFFLSF